MRRSALLALVLLLAAPPAGRAEGRAAPAARARARGRAAGPTPVVRKAAAGAALEKARAQLAAVKRDPAKRRYRHHWERAIRQITRAASGRDAAPGLLDAARARYALYRFSQVEADRDESLKLAARARRAGAGQAAAFAAAVRREAGDEGPRAPPHRASPGRKAARPPSRPESQAVEDVDGEGHLDEALGEALAAGAGDEAMPPPRPVEIRPDGLGPAGEAPAKVSEVRSWSSAGYTRVAVYLSRPVAFARRELPATDGLPRRLAIDLAPAVLEGATPAHPVGDAQVERVRTAQNDAETVRVVLDLHGQEDAQVIAVEDPPRLLVDVGAPAASARPAAAARPEAELGGPRPVRRIVVDAGHGGHDSGAIGPSRVREKDVTLAVARRLAARLEAAGYEVLLTRKDDRYLALEERTAFANARRGDLFVSIHANAHPRRDRRGVETYVLNVADDRYAARLAARENGALRDDAGEGREVRRILSDLDAQSSADSSRRLARLVQREVVAGTRSAAGETRDLGVKSALFYVLLGARMPAVLVETGFISNRAEERRLRDGRFQEAVAASIARGVAAYARSEARVAAR